MVRTAQSTAPLTILQVDTQASYYKWLVTAIMLIAGGTQTFAGNSVNLAIPRLMAAFGTDLATTQWVTTSFLISRTLIIPVLGWLGSVMGNRNLFVTIMLGFVVSSIGCGLSTSLPMLVCFRLMQGFVLGPMEGLTAVILVQTFPPHQRGMALGLRTLGWSIGQIISFTVGGYLMEEVSWRLLFFIGLPTGILSAIAGFLLLPQQRDYRGEPIDYLGLLSLGLFLVPLLLLISLGRKSDTATSTLVLLGVGAVIGSVCFASRELLAAFPAVNLRLFRLPGFRLLCTTAFFNNLGLFGAQFMVPIFLQQVMGLTPLHAGLVIVPALVVSGVSGVITGRLADMISPALVALGGLFLLISVFFLFSHVTALTTIGVLIVYIILYRTCMFSISTPITALNVQVLGTRQVRMGQGLLGVVRNIGASLGVTVTSVFFEQRRVHHQLLAYDTYDASGIDHVVLFTELQQRLQQNSIIGGDTNLAAWRTIQRQMDIEAIAAGFRESFLFICMSFLGAALPMIWMAIRRYDKSAAGAEN